MDISVDPPFRAGTVLLGTLVSELRRRGISVRTDQVVSASIYVLDEATRVEDESLHLRQSSVRQLRSVPSSSKPGIRLPLPTVMRKG